MDNFFYKKVDFKKLSFGEESYFGNYESYRRLINESIGKELEMIFWNKKFSCCYSPEEKTITILGAWFHIGKREEKLYNYDRYKGEKDMTDLEEFKLWLNSSDKREGISTEGWDKFLVSLEKYVECIQERRRITREISEYSNDNNADELVSGESDLIKEWEGLEIKNQKLKEKIRELKENNDEIMKNFGRVYQELNADKPNLEKAKKVILEIQNKQVENKKEELERLKDSLKSKLEKDLWEWLDTMLEAQVALNSKQYWVYP